MLLSLGVKNIALIEELEVDFQQGFHVLTGETGAGKSIIVDALNLVLGNRADRSLIRSGCDRAFVEATIAIDGLQEVKKLIQQELGSEEDIISITRIITSNGRNICKINGESVALQFLQDLMKYIIDLHGQHSYQILMNVENHRDLLDRYGDAEHHEKLTQTAQAYQDWHQQSLQLKKLLSLKKEREMQFDYVSKQLSELDELDLKEKEEEALLLKKEKIDAAIKVRDALKIAYFNLYGFANESAVLQKLEESYAGLSEISYLQKEYKDLYDRLKNSYYELEDITQALRSLRENNEYSEKEELAIVERLDKIKKAKRKFGNFLEIQSKHKSFQEKMDSYVALDDKLKLQEKQYKESLSAYREQSQILSQSRQRIAKDFENILLMQLRDLGMLNIQFEVKFHQNDSKMVPTTLGNDNLEFYISPNVGEPLKALIETASGGELSRFMLALKTIEADKNKISCMIFDEVDTGISGNAAQVVAEKIALISKYRQVLAVSHLAQIASMADVHYFVEKEIVGDRTITSLQNLQGEDRVHEIARLLGTVKNSEETALLHAQNMLASAKKFKESI